MTTPATCTIVEDTSSEACASVTLNTPECYPAAPHEEPPTPPAPASCSHVGDPIVVGDSYYVCTG